MSEAQKHLAIAARYELVSALGKGGHGDVFVAHDTVTGQEVAIKRMPSVDERRAQRIRREIRAMQALAIPGVVRLLDEIDEGPYQYIVMERIHGTPFPGTIGRMGWAALAPIAEALLETLARVHATGIIHRDLKPENVLVTPEGRPVVLDFGLAKGEVIGTSLTGTGVFAGTPAFAAPEQLRGGRADARTDLYAFALMLYGALTGHFPQEEMSLDQLVLERLGRRPVPAHEVAPHVPRHVSDVLHQMLSPSMDARPQDALEALRALRDVGQSARHALPWIGDRRTLDTVVTLARTRQPVSVAGPPGSGRTRFLHEVEMDLERHRVPVGRLPRGDAPFESLRRWRPEVDVPEGARLAELTAHWTNEVSSWLRGGGVLLIDTWGHIDRFSRRVLESCRAEGSVVAADEDLEDAKLHLRPFTSAELAGLFHGPDKLLHLREDASEELLRRTGGLAARVDAELGAWTRAGIAAWRDGALEVPRSELDALIGGIALAPSGIEARDEPPPLRLDQEEFLAWVALAEHEASLDVLAAAMNKDPYEVEAWIEELLELGVLRQIDHRVELRMAPGALQRWSSSRRAHAHAAIARGLPSPSGKRLRHLVLAVRWEEQSRSEDHETSGARPTMTSMELDGPLVTSDTTTPQPDDGTRAVAREALSYAQAKLFQGHTGTAIAALRLALPLVREAGLTREVDAILVCWTDAALGEPSPVRLREAIHAHERFRLGRVPMPERKVLEAVLATLEGHAIRAEALLAQVPPDSPERLLRAAYGARMKALRLQPIEREAAFLAELESWAATSPEAARELAAWNGLHLYRKGDYTGAAEVHRSSWSPDQGVTLQLRALLNASASLLDAGRHAEALDVARQAQELARTRRHAYHEGTATWLVRASAYRDGHLDDPDAELVTAAALLGAPELEGKLGLTEAAVAWRLGRKDLAGDLASRSDAAFARMHHGVARLLARSLAIAIEGGATATDPTSLIVDAIACPYPRIAVQALGLMAAAGHATEQTRTEIARRVASMTSEERVRRFEVLSAQEAIDYAEYP